MGTAECRRGVPTRFPESRLSSADGVQEKRMDHDNSARAILRAGLGSGPGSYWNISTLQHGEGGLEERVQPTRESGGAR